MSTKDDLSKPDKKKDNATYTALLIVLVAFLALLPVLSHSLQDKPAIDTRVNPPKKVSTQLPNALASHRERITRAIASTNYQQDARLLISRLLQRASIDQQVGASISALQDLQFAFRVATSNNYPDLLAKITQQMALIHQERNEHALALSYLEQSMKASAAMVNQTKGNDASAYKMEEQSPPLTLMMATSLLATKQIAQADAILSELSPHIPDKPLSIQADYFALLGEVKLQQENISESIRLLQKAQMLIADNDAQRRASIHLLLSKARTLSQDIDQAISQLVKAFELASQTQASFVLRQALQIQRAALLSRLNEHEAAYNVIQNVIDDRELVHPIAEIKRMLDMHGNFQLELQQQENADLKQQNKWQTEQIETKQLMSRLYLLIMALLFCLSCLLLLVFLRARKHKQSLEKLAHTDQLTQLHSRPRIMELLSLHQDLFGRSEQAYCVAVVDLDYFKNINDTYGHQVGDEVLKAFGRIAITTFRQTDLIGRIGGEEFLFVLPNTEPDQAKLVFQQFNDTLSAIANELELKQTVSASIGLVSPFKGEAILDIIKRADDALYQAKAQGRNQVVFLKHLNALQQ